MTPLSVPKGSPRREQQILEPSEGFAPELGPPFLLDGPQDPVDLRVCGVPAIGQADDARARLGR